MNVGRVGAELAFTVLRRAARQARRRPAVSSRASTRPASGACSSRGRSSPRTRSRPARSRSRLRPSRSPTRGIASLATLPADWSDLLCALELDSSALLPRAALLAAPLNPTRAADRVGFTFRCAQRAGYGVSPAMARRCFERLDAEGILGRVEVLRVLSDTDNVATQGAVWYVGGKVL